MYRKGPIIVTMVDKTIALEEGCRIWWNGKSYDARWIGAWPWAQIRVASLYRAEFNPEYLELVKDVLAAPTDQHSG
jgi:hypothetical protein